MNEAPHHPAQPKPAVGVASPARGPLYWVGLTLVIALLAAALVFFVLHQIRSVPPETPTAQLSGTSSESGDDNPSEKARAAARAQAKKNQLTALQALADQVPALRSLNQAPDLSTVKPSADVAAAASSAGATGFAQLTESLSALFLVRRLDPSAKPFASDQQVAMARQELRLYLLAARLGLMTDLPTQAYQDLGNAQRLLPQYFETQDALGQAFSKSLTELVTQLGEGA